MATQGRNKYFVNTDKHASSDRGRSYGVVHGTCSSSGDLESAIVVVTSLALKNVRDLIHFGAVYVNEKRCVPNLNPQVEVGDRLRIHTNPRRFPIERAEGVRVIYEDQDFLVVDKPSGLPVHSTVDNLYENLIYCLSVRLGYPLFVTHRLDAATSGLLVLAKNPNFQREFNQLLRAGQVKKIYKAVVVAVRNQVPKVSTLQHFMEPSPRAPKKVSLDPNEAWLRCILHIRSVEPVGDHKYILKIELVTGRTHQIRSQLAYEGFPIDGDSAYGATSASTRESEISLKSVSIQFLGREFHID